MADDTGIVDENIDPAEFIHGLPNNGLRALFRCYARIIRNGNASLAPDPFDHPVRIAVRRSMSVMGGAQIVYDDTCALCCETDRIRPAQPVPGARNNGDSPLQQIPHMHLLPLFSISSAPVSAFVYQSKASVLEAMMKSLMCRP